jgi:Tfp pilus assembly protein PilW
MFARRSLFAVAVATVLGVVGCQSGTGTGAGTSTRPGGTAAAKKLTVTFKEGHTVQQGAEDDVMVTINRDNFSDPVSVKVEGLPDGVTADALTIASSDSTGTLKLRAAADAKVVESHAATVVADAPGVSTVKVPLKVTVRAK